MGYEGVPPPRDISQTPVKLSPAKSTHIILAHHMAGLGTIESNANLLGAACLNCG